MRLVDVNHDRIPAAAHTLARAMFDEPLGRYLIPDPDEFLTFHRGIYATTIERALEDGRVDAWGDPIVGVAAWMRRPAIEDDVPPSADEASMPEPTVVISPHAAERVEACNLVLRQLRERARPDRHVYLDTIGVLPEFRRHGIASGLLDAGHAWADAAGLPCALDTFDHANVAFYARRGYRIVAAVPLPGSGLQGTAMRRHRSRGS